MTLKENIISKSYCYLNNYYVKIENKLYKLADLELIKKEVSRDITLTEGKAALDASSSSKVS